MIMLWGLDMLVALNDKAHRDWEEKQSETADSSGVVFDGFDVVDCEEDDEITHMDAESEPGLIEALQSLRKEMGRTAFRSYIRGAVRAAIRSRPAPVPRMVRREHRDGWYTLIACFLVSIECLAGELLWRAPDRINESFYCLACILLSIPLGKRAILPWSKTWDAQWQWCDVFDRIVWNDE